MRDEQALLLPLLLEVNSDGYWASVPEIQGAIAEGDTMEDAVCNCIDVVKLIAAYRKERGESLGFNTIAMTPAARLTIAMPMGPGTASSYPSLITRERISVQTQWEPSSVRPA